MKEHLNTFLIALAIVIASWSFSGALKQRKNTHHTISVTGLGKKDFTADFIVWSGSFARKNLNLKEAYAELDRDRESIRSYLLGKGIKESNIVFSAVDIDKEFQNLYDRNGNQSQTIFTGYRLRQNVQIESNEVDKTENVSRQVTELINSGVEFNSNSPQYYYTKLAELKIEMIAEATRDAQTRAQKIAEHAGGGLGKLQSANMGVFQIVAQNSSEEYSWGGSFNTSSKKKTATIPIKLEYEIEQ